MRALLDINVLIALLDPDHAFHERAHVWWKANSKTGWASCPLVENGVVRIMANPAYTKTARFSPEDLISLLRLFVSGSDHEFWPDSLSLRDSKVFIAERIHGSNQITDLYLLALAVRHGGRLATFDQNVSRSAVCSARLQNLCLV